MSIKPILFSTPMVQAILEGRKTMTRRVAKELDDVDMLTCRYVDGDIQEHKGYPIGYVSVTERAPYRSGDVLWVRETWRKWTGGYSYKADVPSCACMWRPSIHMPKAVARIFLRVTDVRVEQVQDISSADAHREGVDGRCLCPSSGCDGSLSVVERDFSIERFGTLWDSTVKKSDLPRYGWEANPWVWVYAFERCERPDGWPI